MEKSTLVEILRTFSKDELDSFGDFTSSPYFNKKSNVTKLYAALKKLAPDFTAEKITKEEMWKQVFPGKKYNYGIMKNLIYDLNKLAVKFLELEIYSQKTFEQDINQLDAYRLKNLKQHFIKKTGEARKALDNRPLDNQSNYMRYLLNCSEMSFLDYSYLHTDRTLKGFDEIDESLMLFYCTNQLYHNVNNIQYAFNISAQINDAAHERVMRLYESSPYKNAFTDILKSAYEALSGPGTMESYQALKKVFFENYKKCSKPVQYDLMAMMINFCRNNDQRGNSRFIKEEFIYVKLMIEEKLYMATTFGWIDQYLFMQAVMSACRAGEFDWAEKFINGHSHELIENLREQYTNYAYITLNLRRKQFKAALAYIAKLKNVDKGDRLNIKVFEFNAYYELGYYDELKSLADTTAHLLKNDKYFSADDKASFKNYIIAICRLMDYKCKAGKKYLEENFLDEVTDFINSNRIRNKLWLLQKIEELKQKP